MLDLSFYLVCIEHLASDNSFYWLPLKIYSSRSSCKRFIKNYKYKPFDFSKFKIVKLSQANILELPEVKSYGKD